MLLDTCIDYLSELWKRDSLEEWNNHWKDIIGMTDEEMERLDLARKE